MFLHQLENETFIEYKIRICLGKLDKEVDLEWSDIVKLLGMNCSSDHLRKTAYGYREYREKVKIDCRNRMSDNEILEEIEMKTLELQKERYKLADAKRLVNKQIRESARREFISDEMLQAIERLNYTKPLQFNSTPVIRTGDNEGIIMLSDWHYGIKIDNYWNRYSVEILEERVRDIVSQINDYVELYDISKLHVVLNGDFISGNIHTTIRIVNQLDIIDQTIGVAELLAETINEISQNVNAVDVYCSLGNHSRVNANLKESVTSENFERFIFKSIKNRLKGNTKVTCKNNRYDHTMVTFDVFEEKVFAAHGDKDHCNSVVNNMNKLLDFNPTLVLLGHIHHFTSKDFGSGTVITGGSLVGMDEYTVDKRIYGRPYQNMIIVNKDLGRIGTIELKTKA